MRALLVAFLLLTGCVARPDHEVAGPREVHEGEEIVLTAGRLDVPVGAVYELRGGALRLHDDPDVTVDGIIDVRGAFVARDAVLANLFRLVVHPGASLVLENVTLEPGPVPAAIDIRSADARIHGGRLAVRTIEVRAAASIVGATIAGDTALPAVYWKDAPATFRDNLVETPGHGVVLDGATGEVAGNTVVAGQAPGTVGIAVRRGSVSVAGNAVTAAVGIAFDGAGGEARENTVHDAAQAGIALVASDASVTGNVVERSGRAGIFLDGSDAVVRGNRVEATGDGTAVALKDLGAGIAVDGGAPTLEANDLLGNDVGIAVLAGTPSAHQNNIEGNRHAGAALANATRVDFTMNWWGAPTGPVPATAGTPAPATPSPAGADRVDPRILYQPWLVARRG